MPCKELDASIFSRIPIRLNNDQRYFSDRYQGIQMCIRDRDIPPGYLHCIENTGTQDMVVIIWANEVFDETYPDTYYKEV